MTAITSAAAFFRASAGKQVRKTVTGVATVETWDANKAEAIRQLLAQGCREDAIKSDETGLSWPGGFILRPNLKAVETGTLQVRSADYGFTGEGAKRPSWGDKKGATVEDGALVKRYPNGMTIRFEIIG